MSALSEVIGESKHTKYHYVVGCRSEWIDDWQCGWDSWGPDPSARTSRLSSAQVFETYEGALKNRICPTDSVYRIKVETTTSVVISVGPAESGMRIE